MGLKALFYWRVVWPQLTTEANALASGMPRITNSNLELDLLGSAYFFSRQSILNSEQQAAAHICAHPYTFTHTERWILNGSLPYVQIVPAPCSVHGKNSLS